MEEKKENDNVKRVCEICKRSDSNVLDYGPWKTFGDCTIHYFCALFFTDLETNGNPDGSDGIHGFLVEDIREKCRAYTKTKCYYCQHKRATVRCQQPQCKRIFHFICGIERKCLNQFSHTITDTAHPSFCDRHVVIDENQFKHSSDAICHICGDPMGEYDKLTSIPSCCNDDYYHKKCMQEYAVQFGSLAHCPSCRKDADGYRLMMTRRGIYCPIKDAEYELVPDAFKSLHKATGCIAEICKCTHSDGRDHDMTGKWEIHRCRGCGAGLHGGCCDDSKFDETYKCDGCAEILAKSLNPMNVDSTDVAPRGVIRKDVDSKYNSPKNGKRSQYENPLDHFFSTVTFNAKPRPRPWHL